MRYLFKSKAHPGADGRRVKKGDEIFVVLTPLEEKGLLTLELGPDDFANLAGVVLAMLADEPEIHAEARGIARKLIKKRAKP